MDGGYQNGPAMLAAAPEAAPNGLSRRAPCGLPCPGTTSSTRIALSEALSPREASISSHGRRSALTGDDAGGAAALRQEGRQTTGHREPWRRMRTGVARTTQSRPASMPRGCGPAADSASFSGSLPTNLDGNFGMNVVTSVVPRAALGPEAVRPGRNAGAPAGGPAGFAHVAAGGIHRRGGSSGRSSSPNAGRRCMALPGRTGSGRRSPGVGLRPVAADGLWRRVVSGIRHPRAGDGRGGDFRGPIRHVVGLGRGRGRGIEPAGLVGLRAERTLPAQAVAELAASRAMRMAAPGALPGSEVGGRGSAG